MSNDSRFFFASKYNIDCEIRDEFEIKFFHPKINFILGQYLTGIIFSIRCFEIAFCHELEIFVRKLNRLGISIVL